VLSVACADPDLGFGATAAVFLAMSTKGHAGIFGCEASLFTFARNTRYAEADIVPVYMGRAATVWIDR
jgi:hypothetical protein